MTTLQFSLFFAALLVAYVLVHVRMARFDAHLRQLSRLQSLDDGVTALGRKLDARRFDEVDGDLARIREELEAMHATLGRIERDLVEAVAAPRPLETPRHDAAERIRGLVESRLLQLGYSNLRILSDLSTASLDAEVSVLVECERNNLQSKGTVTVQNGSVRDVRLQNVTQMFP